MSKRAQFNLKCKCDLVPSPFCFYNVSANVAARNKIKDSFKICMGRAFQKCSYFYVYGLVYPKYEWIYLKCTFLMGHAL